MFGANVATLAEICDKLSCRKAKFPRILSQNGQNVIEGQGQWPPFSIPAECIPGCMFSINLVILAQICDKLLCGQAKFPRILSQNGKKWPWRSLSMTSIFNTNWEYPTMHVWCKFCDSSSNLWRVIIQTRKSLWTDRQNSFHLVSFPSTLFSLMKFL